MYDSSAPTASMLLDSLAGDAANFAPLLAPWVDRLGEIEELLLDAEDGPSKSETIKAAREANSPMLAVYLAAELQLREAYAYLQEDVFGILPESDAAALKSEASDLGKKIKSLVFAIERTMGEDGFVNTFMKVVPKPEGSYLREYYKSV